MAYDLTKYNIDLEDGEIESDNDDFHHNKIGVYNNNLKSDIQIMKKLKTQCKTQKLLNKSNDLKANDSNDENMLQISKNSSQNYEIYQSDNYSADDEMIYVRGASPVNKKFKIDFHLYENTENYNTVYKDYDMFCENYLCRYYDDNDDYYNSENRGKLSSRAVKRRHRKGVFKKSLLKLKRKKNKYYKSNENHNQKNEQRQQQQHKVKNTTNSILPVSSSSSSSSSSLRLSVDNRKLQICKFYLMDCCVRPFNCNYMHSEFPCKYYYLGMRCENKQPCKFMHGNALNDQMKNALLKHIMAAPKKILGNFKRLSHDEAIKLFNIKNAELLKNEIEINLNETNCTNHDKTSVEMNNNSKGDINKNNEKTEKILNTVAASKTTEKLNSKENESNLNNLKQKLNCFNNKEYYDNIENYTNEWPPVWDIEGPFMLKDFQIDKNNKVILIDRPDALKQDSVQLINTNLSTDMIKNAAKYNITNLYQLNQLSLAFLEELNIYKIPEGNKQQIKIGNDLVINKEKSLLEDQDIKEPHEIEKKKNLGIKENTSNENFNKELNSKCEHDNTLGIQDADQDNFKNKTNEQNEKTKNQGVKFDLYDDEKTLIREEPKVFDNSESALMDEIFDDMKLTATENKNSKLNDDKEQKNEEKSLRKLFC